MQARYQHGNLTVRKRKLGPDVWQFRWTENGRPRSVLIGTLEQYPRKADAERAVEYRRWKVNARNPQGTFERVTVAGLIERYKAEEIPERHSTRVSYLSLLKAQIIPRWGGVDVGGVRALDVEAWLAPLPLAAGTKARIRGLMHILFQCARRWEIITANPIDLVRQSAKRLSAPRLITPSEFSALLANLTEPFRTMVLVAGCLGLRASEVMGLQWQDFNFNELTLTIQRGIVYGRVGGTKTEASGKPIPLDAALASEILRHRERCLYLTSTDYVFAADSGKPRSQGTILKEQIKPAAVKAGIQGKVGWHTLRHSFSTLLRVLGTDVKVHQELLRHADVSTTLNVYTQAVSEQKREAASKVAKILVPGKADAERVVERFRSEINAKNLQLDGSNNLSVPNGMAQ